MSKARAWTVAAVALLAIPTLAGNAPTAGASSQTWPPAAWTRGDISDLTLHEILLLSSGIPPGTPQADALRHQARAIERLAAPDERMVRTLLEGVALAAWHQDGASAGLSDVQRNALSTAGDDDPQLQSALDGIDDAEVLAALAALDRAVAEALPMPTAGTPSIPDLAPALADELGVGLPQRPTAAAPPSGPALAALAAGLSGLAPDSPEAAALERQLAVLPSPVRAALGVLLGALAAVQQGEGSDPERLVEMAQAVDGARDTLRIWVALTHAQRIRPGGAGPIGPLPDPDADRPPLRFGLGAQKPVALASAPHLADALRGLARAVSDPVTAAQADTEGERLARVLGPARSDAVAQVLAETERYILTTRAALAANVPPALADDPSLLDAWASAADTASLPAPGTPSAEALLQSVDYLRLQADADAALQGLLAATEALVPVFAAAEEGPVALPPCDVEGTTIGVVLSIDPCGEASDWKQPTILTLDVGGDDNYTQRAGAPFRVAIPRPEKPAIGAPVALVLDLGGNDTYYAPGEECAQGAACSDHPESIDDVGRLRPVAVLVDWDGDGAQASNRFFAAARSQGYGGNDNIPPSGIAASDLATYPKFLHRPYGVLVERVGAEAWLRSSYEAGNLSQGAAAALKTGPAPARDQAGAGLLLRLIGSGGDSSSTFTAGDDSQAFNGGGGATTGHPPLAALLNLGGAQARHHDIYRASDRVQGSTLAGLASALALFVDLVGPGGFSNDTYVARDAARGFGPTNQLGSSNYAVFIDGVAGGQPAPSLSAERTGHVEGRAAAAPGHSDDSYNRLPAIDPAHREQGERGHGLSSGMFLDVGGQDDYNGAAVARNDARWRQPPLTQQVGLVLLTQFATGLTQTGLDTASLDDLDGDALPAGVEQLVRDYAGLWDAGDDDPADRALGVAPAFVVDLVGGTPEMNASYAFVLNLLGDTVYGPAFSANVLLDLDGDDVHLGHAAAASLLPEGHAERQPARALDRMRDQTPEAAPAWGALHGASLPDLQLPDLDAPLPVAPPVPLPDSAKDLEELRKATPRAGTQPGARIVSFLLDLQGQDTYRAAKAGGQGFGQGRGAGILLDLSGSDLYEAPSHAQGVGLDGGIGILADVGNDTDTNTFRAGPPSQGVASGLGALGVLVARGDHNRFDDGEGVPQMRPGERDGRPDGSLGASANLASTANGAPQIGPLTLPEGPFEAGRTYTFAAKASDPEGDDLEFCWRMATSAGLDEPPCASRTPPAPGEQVEATFDYAWMEVWTDAQDAPSSQHLDFAASLVVRDSGGQEAQAALGTYRVANLPPRVWAPPRGIQQAQLTNDAATLVFQVPVRAAPNVDNFTLSALISWGDGPAEERQAELVDWGAAAQGGFLVDPPQVENLAAARLVPSCIRDGSTLAAAVDGNDQTFTAYEFGGPCPFVVSESVLAGPRLVSDIEVVASLSPGTLDAFRPDTGLRLSAEATRADGSILPLGFAELSVESDPFDPDVERQVLRFSVVPPQDVSGLAVRHLPTTLPPGGLNGNYGINIHSLRAMGPGFPHTWTSMGNYDVRIVPLDRFGGRNATAPFQVAIGSDGMPPSDFAADYVDFSGRGSARHISVAPGTTYTVAFRALPEMRATDILCVSWGDGARTCTNAGLAVTPGAYILLRHAWADPGSYEVTATYDRTGHVATLPVAKVNAEPAAIEIFADGDDDASGAVLVRSSLPWIHRIAFLALDPAGAQTWHSGVPPLLTLDAAGNDRYNGTAAASQRDLTKGQQLDSPFGLGVRPSLLVDRSGNDDYLSMTPRTQAFAERGGAALLVDVAGDDLYVAPGLAQGVGGSHGAAALVDLGGDDRFNPVSSGHPDVLAGMAGQADPWTVRPATLSPARTLRSSAGLATMQGAGLDGVGLLLLRGGHDELAARSHSQGYGGHASRRAVDYAMPDPDCGFDQLPGQPSLPPSGAPQIYPGIFLPGGLLCWVGLRNFDPNTGLPVPIPSGAQGTSLLSDFISVGPRFGPSAGVLAVSDSLAVLDGQLLVQGAGSQGGRGALLAPHGGVMLGSAVASQAASHSAQTVLVSGGALAARLREFGQGMALSDFGGNPETLEAPVSLLVARQSQAWLNCADACAGPGQILLEDQGLPLGPELAWIAPPPPRHGGQTLDLALRITPLPIPVISSQMELVALGMSGPWKADGTCDGGAPFAPPVRLATIPLAPAAQTVSLTLDLRPMAPDGPVLALGCVDVVVMARHAAPDGSSLTPWSLLASTIRFDSAPALERVEPDIRSAGGSVRFHLATQQPEAAVDSLAAELLILPLGQSPEPEAAGAALAGWSSSPSGGAVAEATWNPGGSDPPGAYRAWTRSHWLLPGLGFGPWQMVEGATFTLLRVQPTFALQALPAEVRLDRPLTLLGTATHGAGVADVHVRLLDAATGLPIGLTRPLPGPFATAQLASPGNFATAWSVSLQPDIAFAGGPVHIQVNVTHLPDAPDAIQWTSLPGTVLLDGAAPRIASIVTPIGTQATNADFPIDFTVQLTDAPRLKCSTTEPCGPGAGVDTGRLGALVLSESGLDALQVVTRSATVGGGALLTLRWTGSGGPPDGVYRILLLTSDEVGNVAYQWAGTAITVDHTAPTIYPPVQLAGGATAIRPGISIHASSRVTEDGTNAAGMDAVEFELLGVVAEASELGNSVYGATLDIPNEATGGDMVDVVVTATDKAGNVQTLSVPFPFIGTNLAFKDGSPTVAARTTSMEVRAKLNRPAALVRAELELADGTFLRSGDGDSGAVILPAGDAGYAFWDADENGKHGADEPFLLHFGPEPTVAAGDLWLSGPAAFTLVTVDHAAVGDNARVAAAPGSAAYHDLDVDGAFGPNDVLYLDADGNAKPSLGDLRLMRLGAMPAGSAVAAGDGDASLTLGPALLDSVCFRDGNSDGQRQADEALYLGPSCDEPLGASHLRLTPVQGRPGGTLVLPTSRGAPDDMTLHFTALTPGTSYTLRLQFRDAAGWKLYHNVTVPTPGGAGSLLELGPAPAGSISGIMTLKGLVTVPTTTPARLSLHVDSPFGPSVDALTVADAVAQPFELSWDSATRFGGQVLLYVVLDDGVSTFVTEVPVMVDNVPPDLELVATGATPDGVWYNSTVIVHAVVADATGPVLVLLQEGDGAPETRSSILLATDGTHVVTAEAFDGAVPPLSSGDELEVRVDRTPPELKAGPNNPKAARNGTGGTELGLTVSAKDATSGSGIDAYRVRAGGAWSPWAAAAPTLTTLPAEKDGQTFVEVEVRDLAHNVQRVVFEATLDRAKPELLGSRWVGFTGSGDPVLHVVARDVLLNNVTGRPSGVDAIRFARPGSADFTDWTDFDGNEAVTVPRAGHDGRATIVFLRDAAGNVANVGKTANNTLSPNAPALAVPPAPAPPTALLMTEPGFVPDAGPVGTTFAFSVLVAPHGGKFPDAVFLEVDGVRTPLNASGPLLAGGARSYVGFVSPSVTVFDKPHTYQVIAQYGAETVTSDVMVGPLVTAAGARDPGVRPATDGKRGLGIPAAGPGAAFAVLLAGMLFSRRKRQ